MEAVVPVPLLSHAPQPYRFSSSGDIEVPSRLVIPVIPVFWLVFLCFVT